MTEEQAGERKRSKHKNCHCCNRRFRESEWEPYCSQRCASWEQRFETPIVRFIGRASLIGIIAVVLTLAAGVHQRDVGADWYSPIWDLMDTVLLAGLILAVPGGLLALVQWLGEKRIVRDREREDRTMQ